MTIFNTVPGKQINPAFGDIVVGHKFKSGTAETWDRAYCYLNLIDDGKTNIIDLSQRSSFNINSKPTLDTYKFDTRYTLSEFSEAQSKCRYQWYGFN